jgi:hypothetical protein
MTIAGTKCRRTPVADANSDGDVDLQDLSALLAAFGSPSAD